VLGEGDEPELTALRHEWAEMGVHISDHHLRAQRRAYDATVGGRHVAPRTHEVVEYAALERPGNVHRNTNDQAENREPTTDQLRRARMDEQVLANMRAIGLL
jgi:hypothetical protein